MQITNFQGRDKTIASTAFVVFDTETSLISSYEANKPAFYDMVEIACVATTVGKTDLQTFESIVKPYYPFNAASCGSKHITAKVLASAPKFPEIADKLIEIFGDRVVVGQNTQFDIRVLRMVTEKYANLNQLKDSRVSALTQIIEKPYLDTRKLFTQLYPDQKESSLDYLMKFFGIAVSNRQKHLAVEDAQLTLQVFERIVDTVKKEKGVETIGNVFDFQNGTFGMPNQLPLL